jgi:flagellar export protein FliJ
VLVAKRDRIETLQRLASHTEASDARQLAERLRALDTEERRLQQIRGYLAEYSQSGGQSGGQSKSMTIGSLRSGRGFLERLRGAVDEQRGAVATQRHLVDQQTLQWRASRARTRSLEKLGERLGRQEQDLRDQREQTRLDEVATSLSGHGRKV